MARTREAETPAVEELLYKSDSVFMCLLVNRRTRFIRVIDFRAGALPAKRLYIQGVARREGIEKVITLVEKDEVSSWTRLGFVREGTIPGFYKRSDGHLCGCLVGERTASAEVSEDGIRLAERTVNAARKAAAELPEHIRGICVEHIDEEAALNARDQAWKRGVGVGSFDDFGRDAERYFVRTSGRRGKPNYLVAEYQDCFGHSLVEALRAPEGEGELLALTHALRQVCDELTERGIVSAFAFAPSDDVELATAYTAAGFRKTGLLAGGIFARGTRRDAVLWTRRLANPATDAEPEPPTTRPSRSIRTEEEDDFDDDDDLPRDEDETDEE
ncbi:MAG: hypothetical protein NZ898_16400 [Myxococcota bacterium]|nr:hypothetical protein [Myxococcota bacterium]MDW8362349.1 hypothetical protein [Myxococcales bacterium]